MNENNSHEEKKSWFSEDYRLVLFNEETYERLGSTGFRLRSLIFLLSFIALIFFVLNFLLIAYTPLKTYVPGFDEVQEHRDYKALLQRTDSVENALESKHRYVENIRSILRGETPPDEENLDFEEPNSATSSFNPSGSQVDSIENAGVNKEDYLSFLNRFGNNIPLDRMELLPPLTTGILTSGYDPSINHFAIDVAAETESPVKAVKDGRVVFSEWSAVTGHVIILQHPGNLLTLYKHNDFLYKSAGEFVYAGEPIAKVGESGQLATGPHLHFEMWHNGQPIDPARYFNF